MPSLYELNLLAKIQNKAKRTKTKELGTVLCIPLPPASVQSEGYENQLEENADWFLVELVEFVFGSFAFSDVI